MSSISLKRFFPFDQYAALIVAWLLSIYGMVIRFLTLMKRGFSGDELFQYDNIKGPLKAFWQHHCYGDMTSFPGEYWLTYPLVRLFGMNRWALAVPHIILTGLGFYFLYKVSRKYFTTLWATAVTFLLVALNVNLVYHSFEYRPYAVLPTLALGSLYFADKISERYHALSSVKKLWIGIFYVVTMNYHAYGVLIYVLPVLFILASRWQGNIRENLGRGSLRFFIIVFLLGFPLWCWHAGYNNFGIIPQLDVYSNKEPFAHIPNPVTNITGFIKGILGNLVGCRSLYFLLIGGAGSFLVPHQERLRQILFLVILVILPITLILLVDIFSRYWFLQRQFIWIVPLFALFLGWSWESMIKFITGRHCPPP